MELADLTMVIACDSAGAIGNKTNDVLNVPGEILGKMIASVPLMEVMASGADPVSVINTLSVEMHPTGDAIIMGVKQAVQEAGVPLSVINGSTEENMPTVQTGLGITVVGTAKTEALKLGTSMPGDLVYCLGKPLVGREVLEFGGDAAQISTMRLVLNLPGVHEILPVGSKGIEYELEQLSRQAGLGFEMLETASTLDLEKSAGPASCILITTKDNLEPSFIKELNIPVTLLAKLI